MVLDALDPMPCIECMIVGESRRLELLKN